MQSAQNRGAFRQWTRKLSLELGDPLLLNVQIYGHRWHSDPEIGPFLM